MVSKRTSPPWMPADEYGRSLKGLGINLLVRDIEKALPFQNRVLGAETVYADPDIAVLRFTPPGADAPIEWMLHADHTYDRHPLSGNLDEVAWRGIGVELRLHGRDPDVAEAEAQKMGAVVLAGALDKPHGLREAYLVDEDGYLWVPDLPIDD